MERQSPRSPLSTLTSPPRGDVNLPAFLTAQNLKPFISSNLEVTSSQIEFRTKKGGRAFGYASELLPDEHDDAVMETAGNLVDTLFTALQQFAPPYAHFGAHEGDGSDYGFWVSSDALDEFDGLRVTDTNQVPDKYDGEVLHVNDHGNVTLYVASNGVLKEIWGVV